MQGIVQIIQIIAGFDVLTRELLQHSGKCGGFAAKAVVEIVGIQLAVELIDRTDQRTHRARFAAFLFGNRLKLDLVYFSVDFYSVKLHISLSPLC